MGIIEIKGLHKTYGGKTRALIDVNISIMKGEWVCITGPSGSGKTTLLNMISCLDTPSKGELVINRENISSFSQTQLTRFRRESIGLIFQQYHLVPYLTALENVMIAQYYHSLVDEDDARNALEEVGMGHRLDHIPAHLSGGEQQRVCIARALINGPHILLADEPTGNLDQANGKKVLNLIRKLNKQGQTVILVTHDPAIAKMGTRIINLIDGKVNDDSVT